MTRTALGTPEEPDDPFDQFEAEFADIERTNSFEALAECSCALPPVRWMRASEQDDALVHWWIRDSRNPAATQLKSSHLSWTMPRTLVILDGLDESVRSHWDGIFIPGDDCQVIASADALMASRLARYARLLLRNQYARVSPQKLTGLAVLIAGRKRAAVGCEWRAHLSGETGAGLSADRQVGEAAGFLLAAVRYRLQDATALAWRPVDAVLGSRALSSYFVLLATLSFSLWFMRKVGVYGLAACLESVAVVFGTALGTIHLGRWWRGVKPPEHRPRRAKELFLSMLTSFELLASAALR